MKNTKNNKFMKNDIIKKGDMILVVLLLLAAGLFFLIGSFRKPGNYAVVDSSGDCQTYSLNENQEIVIDNAKNHGKNIISIKDGTVSMTYATCPDLICVHHHSIEKNGETIICVPNDVSVRIVSTVENDIDN